MPPSPRFPRCRGAYLALGDLTGDGHLDLVYHGYPHGGSYQTQFYMLAGDGNGGFAPIEDRKLILTSPHAATGPILADSVGGGDFDISLPPDDDVRDQGQCHIALNAGGGKFSRVDNRSTCVRKRGPRPRLVLRPCDRGRHRRRRCGG